MKKLYVLGVMTLVVAMLAACGSAKTEEAAATEEPEQEIVGVNTETGEALGNPVTEVASLDELNNTLGCYLFAPGDLAPEAQDVSYAYITVSDDQKIAQYIFTINDAEYCVRYSAVFEGDIAGVYSGEGLLTDQITEDAWPDFTVVSDDSTVLAHWLTVDGQYTMTAPLDKVGSVEDFTTFAQAFSRLTVRADS